MTRPSVLPASQRRERGIVLIIALIVLMIMSMAGVLMLRSIGSGLGIAGNVAFKEGATMSADRGIEFARDWVANVANLKDTTDTTARPGYFATWNGGVEAAGAEFNPFTYAWDTAGNSVTLAAPAAGDNGNRVQYVIHRLCELEGAITVANQQCTLAVSTQGFTNSGQGGGGSTPLTPNYRITTRVLGPRNTISYVQAIVY